ncbi:MAG TPA: type III PLP-dependent enzyme [Acidisarcina sp.]
MSTTTSSSAATAGTAAPGLRERLSEELFLWRDGQALLRAGRIPIEQIAASYGTPAYIYDESLMVRQYERLRSALPDAVEIYYSIKANPHPRVITAFVKQGAGCEIASGGEYVLARRSGVFARRIVFAGPGKGADELEYVVAHGIGEIHLEGFEEIETLNRIAARRGAAVDVSLRVNPGAALGGGLLMGGQPTAFGFEEESLHSVVSAVNDARWLRMRGLHMYTGTQILDAESLLRHWGHAIEVARQLSDLAALPLATIDLGGGLGVPYFAHEKDLDLQVLCAGARTLIRDAQADPRLAQARFLVEPGRFLVGPSGIYVTSVRTVKTCRGTTFVVLDGGMNHHLAASGNLGQVVRRDFPIINLSRHDAGAATRVVVVGPLCTPIDTLGRSVEMELPQPGDLIGILQSGAYGLTASPLGFLNHPTPAEVMITDRSAELITARGASFAECAL